MLPDGTQTYLYGTGRIAQYNASGADYCLADALGSVKQLVDATGAVEMAKIYEPYGDVLNDAGTGDSSYGFTGEWTDGYIELLYLPSRYYSLETGRFLTKDSWRGDYTKPMSYSGWLYVYSNPVNLTDPAGIDPIDDIVIALRDETEKCSKEGIYPVFGEVTILLLLMEICSAISMLPITFSSFCSSEGILITSQFLKIPLGKMRRQCIF